MRLTERMTNAGAVNTLKQNAEMKILRSVNKKRKQNGDEPHRMDADQIHSLIIPDIWQGLTLSRVASENYIEGWGGAQSSSNLVTL